jgi:extracellular elastinolytic metalloproteinase
MELAPYNPSFLDMRNAILMADRGIYTSAHRSRIWSTFARRGMGFYAGSLGGNDGAPAWDRHVPPTNVRRAFITGHVNDQDSGQPMAGVPVTLAFQGCNGIGNPTAVTKADGSYRIGGVPVGHYRKITVTGAGFLSATKQVTVTRAGATRNFVVRKTGRRPAVAPPSPTSTARLLRVRVWPRPGNRRHQSSGWGSTTGDEDGTPTNDFIPKVGAAR